MLGLSARHMLGLAIGEKDIYVAEVHAAASAGRVVRCVQFAIPPGMGWDKPQELGPRLGAFLTEQKFSTRRAVVGFPGRWVLVKPRSLPPAAPAAAVNILRLAIEREYQADAREWAFDFTGKATAKEKTTVLLAATPQQRLNQVMAVLVRAGVRVESVTSSTLMLALAKSPAAAVPSAVLHLSPEGAELAVRSNGQVVAVERLSMVLAQALAPARDFPTHQDAEPQAAKLTPQPLGTPLPNPKSDPGAPGRNSQFPDHVAGEIRRIMALARPGANAVADTLTIWDSTQIDPQAFRGLSERVGLTAQVNPPLHELGVLNGSPEVERAMPGGAAAVALGNAGLQGRRPCIDFLHSRLVAEKPSNLTRTRTLAILAGLLVLGGLAYLVADWYSEKSDVDHLRDQLSAMKNDVAKARTNLDRIHYAELWFDDRPPLLDCARDLTLAFPPSGQVWATTLTVNNDDFSNSLAGTLEGKSQSKEEVLYLLKRLRASKRFIDVQLKSLQQINNGQPNASPSNSSSPVMAFTLTFVYPDTK